MRDAGFGANQSHIAWKCAEFYCDQRLWKEWLLQPEIGCRHDGSGSSRLQSQILCYRRQYLNPILNKNKVDFFIGAHRLESISPANYAWLNGFACFILLQKNVDDRQYSDGVENADANKPYQIIVSG
jgi:hypothetical protein